MRPHAAAASTTGTAPSGNSSTSLRPLPPREAWLAAQNAQKFFAAIGAALAALEVSALEVLAAIAAGVALGILLDSAVECEGQLTS